MTCAAGATLSDRIIALGLDGFRPNVISDRLGCNVHTVYVTLSRARKDGWNIPRHRSGKVRAPARPVVLNLPPEVASGLTPAARARKLTPHQLAERLVTVIAENGNGLADAVMDDGIVTKG